MNLALFDLDNTLIGGDSDYEWGRFMVAQGLVDAALYEAANQRFYEQYKDGSLDILAYLAFALAPLAERPRAELDALHERFMHEHVEALWLPAADTLVRRHLNEGDLCAIVTATNAFVTGPIVRRLGVPHLIASIPAQENGMFTGQARGTPSFQAGKIARVDEWLESLGLSWQSFERSYFYSDSHNDLPLLQRVSHPVAVDPDNTLRAAAEAAGWPVLSLRS